MSTVYNLEPPTKGKVCLTTSLGDIEIELWPKEAPLACRNFVQLCLEGFYQKTSFHRIIPRFMIQGGDETATGRGGASIYGSYFKDEFHSRLKFTHRGIVACANQNEPDTNNSQFFITLDRCDDLDKRYTIFGKVVGDTIFNVIRISEVPVDSRHKPTELVQIEACEVLWNPFEDLVPRTQEPIVPTDQTGEAAKKPRKKGVKNLALLSFGDEEEATEQNVVVKKKIKSAHDVLDDQRLQHEDEESRRQRLEQEEKRKQRRLAVVRDVLKAKTTVEEEPVQKVSMEEQLRAKVESSRQVESKPAPATVPVIKEVEEQPQMGFDRLFVKKRKVLQEEEEGKDMTLMDEAEQTRERLRRRKKLYGDREKSTLSKLSAFRASLQRTEPTVRKIPAEGSVNVQLPAAWRVGDYLKDMESIGVDELLTHELRFDKTQKDSMSRDMHALDDYIVIDSRLENPNTPETNTEKWQHRPNL